MSGNTSATGGYLQATVSDPIPSGLTLTQFIQSVLVGLSGIDGTLIRPRWQPIPPMQPQANVNWIAFGITKFSPDTYAYVDMDDEGNPVTQRHEDINVQCSFYGPLAGEYAGIVRNGFQIRQNLDVLATANMSFKSSGDALQVPDLINENWVERFEMEIILRREIQLSYPILSLVSASGTVSAQSGSATYTQNWQTQELEGDN